MKLQPLSNRIIIKTLDEEKTTKSGIIIPDNATERPMKGTVIAVGPGRQNEKGETIPVAVKVNDVVLFKKYGPDEVEIDGEKLLVADENDILAVIME